MNEMLIGGIGVAAFVAGLFFMRFWRATGDRFFVLFAAAFWIEGAHRVLIYQWAGNDEASPLYYLPRLLAYGLIIAAIVDKNRGGR
jgi:hypothetical protein